MSVSKALVLTFMLFSPDSPELSLGQTDEDNSTEPHIQLTLLPASPALHHSSFFLFPPLLLSLRSVYSEPHSSTLCRALQDVRLCPSTQMIFPHLLQGFLSPLSVSVS